MCAAPRDWATLIRQQAISGKTASAWCQEQQIDYKNFLRHRKRLLKVEIDSGPFTELHEDTSEPTWLEISICGAKLILAKKFNKFVLTKIVELLRKL